MEIDSIIRIGELAISAIGGGVLVHLFSIRSKVRQEAAGASKAEAEAKADEIENIRQTMDAVYRPIIEDLKHQVHELRREVNEVRDENERLKQENAELREAVREIRPDLVPSRRSIAAQQAPRGRNGQFVKREGEE